MKNTKNSDLSDRRAASNEAKLSLLNAFRSAKTTAEPLKVARQAERSAVAAAREERRVERERLKREEHSQAEAEAAAQAVEALAVTKARESADEARLVRVIEDEAARKAERDRRYANRKARQA